MNLKAVSTIGLTYSILASVLFGIVPWYVQLLGMEGNLLFWNRVVFTGLTVFLLVLVQKRWYQVAEIFQSPKTILLMLAGAVIVGFQWWLFVWAPVNGMTKELSLGYFLLPLTLVLTGRLVYGETIRPLQKIAIVCAAIGVMSEIHDQSGLSWVAVAVSGLYPIYFMLRRKAGVMPLPGMMFEHLCYLPIAIFILTTDQNFHEYVSTSESLWFLLPGLGILCASSMLLYIAASSKLPVGLFGLLSYLEPALLLMVAVLILKEPFSSTQAITYSFIWLAAIIISLDSVRLLRTAKAV